MLPRPPGRRAERGHRARAGHGADRPQRDSEEKLLGGQVGPGPPAEPRGPQFLSWRPQGALAEARILSSDTPAADSAALPEVL